MKMATRDESILIVEDDETVRRLMREELSGEGYRCLEAGDAEQALTRLRDNSVELVILDIRMPGKSGIELLPEIRASNPDTAVVMATAISDSHTAIQCMRGGAWDYITKPFTLNEITTTVERSLEKRRLNLAHRRYQLELERTVTQQTKRIRESFLNSITALAYALEAKDEYTGGHSERVAQVSVRMAEELGAAKDAIERIRLAALVHDIGKIGVQESILHKPATLLDAEYQHVKSHCEIGERILAPVVEDGEILKMVRHHHERYDGTGYPDNLCGLEIPLGARILAVADAYDGMTSQRPYRGALSVEAACAEIRRHAGTQFDPEVGETLLRLKGLVSANEPDQGREGKKAESHEERRPDPIDHRVEQPKVGTRILLVDDDRIIRLLLEETLQEMGYGVMSVESAFDGLECVQRFDIDLVFLDLKMPGMDGAELLRHIKSIKPELPVVIMTGYPNGDMMERALRHKPLAVIKKPFGESEIVAAVADVLSDSRAVEI